MTIYAAIVALGVLFLLVRGLRLGYLRFRGTRVITCPETKAPAAVLVDAKHAAVTAAVFQRHLRLRECSRWPERQNCGQACLHQVEEAPEDCLVRNILGRWYAGKTCVYCGQPLGEIDWLEHRPALVSPDRKTFEWHQLRPETIPEVLATHEPICWDCHISETFRREHPELVVDRDWKHAGAGVGVKQDNA